MNTDATHEELLSRLARGDYQVDAVAVAEAILRRRRRELSAVGRPGPSEVFEAAEIEAPAVTYPSN